MGHVTPEIISADALAGNVVDDDRLDRLLELANPVPNARLEALPPELLAGLRQVVSDRIAKRHRRPRTTAVLALLAATLVLGGVGAAIAAGSGAHTGVFGPSDSTRRPGIESLVDSTEFLDQSAPDILNVIDGFALKYPLPPGGTWDTFKKPYPHKERGYVQMTGLEIRVAFESTCQWQDGWLTAARAKDARSMAAAQTVLDQVPTWPIVGKTVDALGMSEFREIAGAARARNVAEFARLHDLNCRGAHDSPW